MADVNFTPIPSLTQVMSTVADDYVLISRDTNGATPTLVIISTDDLLGGASGVTTFTGSEDVYVPAAVDQLFLRTDVSPKRLYVSTGTLAGNLQLLNRQGFSDYYHQVDSTVTITETDPYYIIIFPDDDIDCNLPDVSITDPNTSFSVIIVGSSGFNVTLTDPDSGAIVAMNDGSGNVFRADCVSYDNTWHVTTYTSA